MTRTEGRAIEDARVKTIEPGVSTRSEVTGAFGEPTETRREDGMEVLVYTYKEKTVPTYLGGIIEGEAMGSEKTTTLEVRLKDGVVSSYKLRTEEDK